jgi:hypothetical protein
MRVLLALTLVALGCSGASSSTRHGRHGHAPPQHLSIPPDAQTTAALGRLASSADRGDAAAAWERAHYLIDVFDDARFRREETSLKALASATRVGPARGGAATERAIRSLFVEVDRVLAIDRLHADAQQARTLLEYDAEPPRERGLVLQRMIELKTIARGGGAMAPNAALRLFGYCMTAARDALRARASERPRIVSHCLFPLWDSDPEPYFAEAPGSRPPAPDPRVVGARLVALLDSTGAPERAAWGRLGLARAAVRQTAHAWFRDHADAITPMLPDLERAGLPSVESARPYDWSPLLDLGDGSKLSPAATYARRIGAEVLSDGRGTLTVSLVAHAPATALIRAAEAGVAARAHTMELLVISRQRLSVPPGDYWAGRLSGDVVRRHGVLPVFLATMPGGATLKADSTRPIQWDPAHASLGLHLVIKSSTWALLGPSGELATITLEGGDTDPVDQLRRALSQVRGAFPDEDALVLVPGADATHGALVTAATAASIDGSGAPLFWRLGLAPSAPAVKRRDLAQRVKRRAAARIEIQPDALAPRAAIARRCYQSLLETNPALSGSVRLELTDAKATVTEATKNKQLRACAASSVAAAMVQDKIASAVVTFSVAKE